MKSQAISVAKKLLKNIPIFFFNFAISMFTEKLFIYKLPSKEYANIFRK